MSGLFKPRLSARHVLCLDMDVPGAAEPIVTRTREDYTYRNEIEFRFRFTKEDFRRVWMAGMGVTEMGQRGGEYDVTWHRLSEFTSNLVGMHSEEEEEPDGYTSLPVSDVYGEELKSADFVKHWEEIFRDFKFAYPDPRLSNADRWNGFSSVQQFSFWKVMSFPLARHEDNICDKLVYGFDDIAGILGDVYDKRYKPTSPAYIFYFYDSFSSEFVVRYVGVFKRVLEEGEIPLLHDEVAVTMYDFHNTDAGKDLSLQLLRPVVLARGFPVRMYYSYYEDKAIIYKFTEEQFRRIWMAGMGIIETRFTNLSMVDMEYKGTWSHSAEFTSKLIGVHGMEEWQPVYAVHLKNTAVCKTWNEWIDKFQFPCPDPGLRDVDRWKGFDSAEKFSFWKVMPFPFSEFEYETRWLKDTLEDEFRDICEADGHDPVHYKIPQHAYMFYFYDSVALEFIVRYVGVFEPIPEGGRVPPGRYGFAVILHHFHLYEDGMQLTSKLLTPILQAAQGGASA